MAGWLSGRERSRGWLRSQPTSTAGEPDADDRSAGGLQKNWRWWGLTRRRGRHAPGGHGRSGGNQCRGRARGGRGSCCCDDLPRPETPLRERRRPRPPVWSWTTPNYTGRSLLMQRFRIGDIEGGSDVKSPGGGSSASAFQAALAHAWTHIHGAAPEARSEGSGHHKRPVSGQAVRWRGGPQHGGARRTARSGQAGPTGSGTAHLPWADPRPTRQAPGPHRAGDLLGGPHPRSRGRDHASWRRRPQALSLPTPSGLARGTATATSPPTSCTSERPAAAHDPAACLARDHDCSSGSHCPTTVRPAQRPTESAPEAAVSSVWCRRAG